MRAKGLRRWSSNFLQFEDPLKLCKPMLPYAFAKVRVNFVDSLELTTVDSESTSSLSQILGWNQ